MPRHASVPGAARLGGAKPHGDRNTVWSSKSSTSAYHTGWSVNCARIAIAALHGTSPSQPVAIPDFANIDTSDFWQDNVDVDLDQLDFADNLDLDGDIDLGDALDLAEDVDLGDLEIDTDHFDLGSFDDFGGADGSFDVDPGDFGGGDAGFLGDDDFGDFGGLDDFDF